MGSLDELLRPNESIELETRRHGGRAAARFVLLVAALGVLASARDPFADGLPESITTWGSLAIGTLLALRFLLALMQWRAETILVTHRRILAASGLFRRKVTSVPLRRVEDLSLDRSFGGRLVGSGDVLIDLDDRRLRLERVADPKRFYRVVLSLVEEGESGPPGDDEADTGPLPRVQI